MREIWFWDIKYNPDKNIKQIAEKCEKTYKEINIFYPIYDELYFDPLHDFSSIRHKIYDIANKLSSTNSLESLNTFFQHGISYIGESQFVNNNTTKLIAYQIGISLNIDSPLLVEIVNTLKNPNKWTSDDSYFKFYTLILKSCINEHRIKNTKNSDIIFNLINEIIEKLPNNLTNLFIYLLFNNIEYTLSEKEINLIYSMKENFLESPPLLVMYTQILVEISYLDWLRFEKTINEFVENIKNEKNLNLLTNFLRTIFISFTNPNSKINTNLQKENIIWLINLMIELPDIDVSIFYNLEKLILSIDLSICYFIKALKKRIDLYNYWDNSQFKIIPNDELIKVIQIHEQSNASDKNKNCFYNLINLLIQHPIHLYFLPTKIVLLDPDIFFLSDIFTKLLNEINLKRIVDKNKILILARISSGYIENTVPWRNLVSKILIKIRNLDKNMMELVMNNILPSISSYSSIVGEISPKYYSNVKKYSELYETEKDEIIKLFWEFMKEKAEFELKQQEELMEEE